MLSGMENPSETYMQLISLHPAEDNPAKIALRRTEAPVDGCIPFHCDGNNKTVTCTVQLTLNDVERECDGGRLCYFTKEGGLVIPNRPAGTLTKHGPFVLHAVTRLHSGVRYSLFVVDRHNGLGEKDVFALDGEHVAGVVKSIFEKEASGAEETQMVLEAASQKQAAAVQREEQERKMQALAVEEWLTSVELSRFAGAIIEQGYESLKYLQDADEEDIDELVTDVGMKKPQAKRLLREWQKLKAKGGS